MIQWKRFGQFLAAVALVCSLFALPASAAGAVTVTIDGQAVAFNESYGHPFIDQAQRTQVPLRKTMEEFGAQVSWDGDTATAIVEKKGTTVEVPVGQPYLLINGVQTPMDTAAMLVDGRTYLPIRPVLEAFGADVSWDQTSFTVTVTTGEPVVRVHFIDVGQGDAILIDYGETEVLIDGGDNKASSTVVSYLSHYVDGALDYLIATHPDADHVGGLDSALAAFQVREVIDSGWTSETKTYQDYCDAAALEPGCIITYGGDRTLDLGRNATLELLETGDGWTKANDNSIVCLLSFGGTEVLFTGDISQNVEAAMLSRFEDIDVLKVAHHGSASSTSAAFLAATQPEYAVASYRVGNSYHHPTAAALQRLFDAGTTVYGTGKSGSIVLTIRETCYFFSTDQALTLQDAGQ